FETDMAAYLAAPKAVLIKGHPSRVSEQRARRVAKAEKRLGLREGIYVLRGAPQSLVRITVKFYPRVQWVVEDINVTDGAPIPGTSRKLTDDIRVRLASWAPPTEP